MTVIEVKPRKWGWCVFESPGVEPSFLRKIRQLVMPKPQMRSSSEMMGRENVSRGQTLLDGEKDTGSLAFAHHAHDVIAGRKLLSIHRLVEVRFSFPLEQDHRGH